MYSKSIHPFSNIHLSRAPLQQRSASAHTAQGKQHSYWPPPPGPASAATDGYCSDWGVAPGGPRQGLPLPGPQEQAAELVQTYGNTQGQRERNIRPPAVKGQMPTPSYQRWRWEEATTPRATASLSCSRSGCRHLAGRAVLAPRPASSREGDGGDREAARSVPQAAGAEWRNRAPPAGRLQRKDRPRAPSRAAGGQRERPGRRVAVRAARPAVAAMRHSPCRRWAGRRPRARARAPSPSPAVSTRTAPLMAAPSPAAAASRPADTHIPQPAQTNSPAPHYQKRRALTGPLTYSGWGPAHRAGSQSEVVTGRPRRDPRISTALSFSEANQRASARPERGAREESPFPKSRLPLSPGLSGIEPRPRLAPPNQCWAQRRQSPLCASAAAIWVWCCWRAAAGQENLNEAPQRLRSSLGCQLREIRLWQ